MAVTGADFKRARTYALDRLARGLPPWLAYHSLAHTSETVIPAAERLAVVEGVSDYERELVATGAAFHDLGFVIQYIGHEAVGVRIGREVLPGMGFSPEEIEIIAAMILATVLPQSPHTLLECLVADADLAILGQDHFLERNTSLRTELAATGKIYTDIAWYRSQLKFLQGHHYWTASARSCFDAQKAENIAAFATFLSEAAVNK